MTRTVRGLMGAGLLLATLALGADPALSGKDTPVIKKTGDRYVVQLPEAMQRALTAYDPTFTIFSQEVVATTLGRFYEYSPRQMPFAIVGDFNGDGSPDVALSGYAKAQPLVLAILSEVGGFQVHEVEKRRVFPGQDPAGLGLDMYLTLIPRGTLVEPYDAKPWRLETDAIQVNIFEKAAVMYYFTGVTFRSSVTGD